MVKRGWCYWIPDAGTIAFQPSYEGFRNFYLDDGRRLYFQKFTNWAKAGHPFKPVTQKFLTYYLSGKEVDYTEGVPTDWYYKKAKKNIDDIEELEMKEYFNREERFLATCNANKNFFTSVETKGSAKNLLSLQGKALTLAERG